MAWRPATGPCGPVPAGRSTFLVTGIVVIPPALGDQFDAVDSAVLPPARL